MRPSPILILASICFFVSCTRDRLDEDLYSVETSSATAFLYSKGDTALISIIANTSWSVTVDATTTQYFSVEPMQGNGNANLVITALSSNADSVARQGSITISVTGITGAKPSVITITQDARPKFARNIFGGSEDDYFVRALPLPDGDFIVAGMTKSADRDIIDTIPDHSSDLDIWLCRLNQAGELKWNKKFRADYNDEYPLDMVTTSDGNFLVAANARNRTILYKFDASGNIIWEKLPFKGATGIAGIIHASDGGFIVPVISLSHEFGWDLPFRDNPARDYANTWIVKLDENGEEVWRTPLAGSKVDKPKDISAAADGGYLVTGYSASLDYDFSGRPPEKLIWVSKFDASGKRTGLQFFEANVEYGEPRITGSSDGGFLLAYPSLLVSRDPGHVSLSKWDKDGQIQWEKMIEGKGDHLCYDLIEDSQGLFRATIKGDNIEGGTSVDFQDAWLVTMNASGNIVDLKAFGGSGINALWSITEISKGRFVLAGYTDSFNGDIVYDRTIEYKKNSSYADKNGWITFY